VVRRVTGTVLLCCFTELLGRQMMIDDGHMSGEALIVARIALQRVFISIPSSYPQ
jgi:hypothetical protein